MTTHKGFGPPGSFERKDGRRRQKRVGVGPSCQRLSGVCRCFRGGVDREHLFPECHDLRHTGAVLAAQTGATLAELMGRLGHPTPGAAMRYQHVAADRDAEIAKRLSALVSDRNGTVDR